MMDFNLSQILKTAIGSYFDTTTTSIIAGMTYGIKSGLNYGLYNNIKAAGLSHLIVFSGSNIVIIYSIFFQSLFFLRSKVRTLATSIAMLIFLAFLPQEPTIMRAAIMWGFTTLSSLLDRMTNKFYALILSIIILTMSNPEIVTNISFQLSVSAILGILMFEFETKKDEGSSHNLIKNTINDLKITVSAQVFTIPLIYFYFNEFNPFSPVTNLLVSPLVRPIMYIGLISPLLYSTSIYELKPISYLGNILVHIIIIVVNIFSKLHI